MRNFQYQLIIVYFLERLLITYLYLHLFQMTSKTLGFLFCKWLQTQNECEKIQVKYEMKCLNILQKTDSVHEKAKQGFEQCT